MDANRGWRRFAAWILVACGILLFATRPKSQTDMSEWKPLQAPVSLQVGTFTSPEFQTQRATAYRILIGSERTLPVEQLNCLLAVSPDRSCVSVPERIGIAWRVLQGNDAVSTGHSSQFRGGIYTDLVAREIGRFPAKRGATYRIELKVEIDGGELKDTQPKLLVETVPDEWKDETVTLSLRSRLQPIVGAICVLAGLLLILLRAMSARS